MREREQRPSIQPLKAHLHQRFDVRSILRGFLGEVEVAEEADQGGHDAAPLLAKDLIERRYQYTSEGRISTAPP